MIDIRKIREDPSEVQASIDRRGLKFNVEELLKLDTERIEQMQKAEALRSKLKIDGKPTPDQLQELQATKKQYEAASEALDGLQKQFGEAMAAVPNFIAPNTPDGGEEHNREEQCWGKTELGFEARDHVMLNEVHDLFNFEAGAKVAGNKFYFLKDKAVRLWQAAQLHAQSIVRSHGFELMSVPHLVNYEVARGTGYMPKGEENQNYIDTQQELVLIATAELPLTGYHKDDILELSKPKLYAGISPCYRLEAGTYGKFSKGLYRTHQFEKLEMYVFCTQEESHDILQEIVAIEEEICQSLEIPYRLVRIAAGDMSAPAYEKYDVEYYSPAEQEYRELTSCSNCTDYQSRNLNIRYKDLNGNLQFAHTLNGTAAVSSRLPIAILENHQQADGSVKLPLALQQYYGSELL